MLLAEVENFVISMGGKRCPRRFPLWNAIDDCPSMTYARFEVVFPDGHGRIDIEVYEKKLDYVWPTYPCVGDFYADKFNASGAYREGDKTIVCYTNGFIPITEENLILHLGKFIN